MHTWMKQYILDSHKIVESVPAILIPQFAKGIRGPERKGTAYQIVFANVFLISHMWYPKGLMKDLLHPDSSRTCMSFVDKILQCKQSILFSEIESSRVMNVLSE